MKTHWFPLIWPAIKPLFLGEVGFGGVPLDFHDDIMATRNPVPGTQAVKLLVGVTFVKSHDQLKGAFRE